MPQLVTLKNRLPEIEAQLRGAELEKVLITAAKPIAAAASARAPMGATGDLKDSIEAKPVGEGEVGIFMAWYGYLVERGGAVNRPPHPFLIPAAEMGRADVAAAVTRWLQSL